MLSRLATRTCLMTGPSIVAGSRMVLAQGIRSSARAGPQTITRPGRQSVKEWLMTPSAGNFTIGKGILAGASAVGLGALCYYGAGLSNSVGLADRSLLWSPVVKQRIADTYFYFGGGIAATAASAVMVARSPRILAFFSGNSLLAFGATIAALIGTNMVTHSIPYAPGVGPKQLAWLTHAALVGAIVSPLCMLGGRVLVQAAWTTAGVCSGLSALAWCAPSDKFLNMGAPLALGLGAMMATSIGSMFVPPHTRLFAGMASFWIYGGVVLFSLFLLRDTQAIARKAETYPLYVSPPFDPVNASLGIYSSTVNLFVRLAYIFGMRGGNQRR